MLVVKDIKEIKSLQLNLSKSQICYRNRKMTLLLEEENLSQNKRSMKNLRMSIERSISMTRRRRKTNINTSTEEDLIKNREEKRKENQRRSHLNRRTTIRNCRNI